MSYRNDLDALQTRLADLERQLATVRKDRVQLEAALQAETELLQELDSTRRALHARNPVRLPMLAQVYVASPCHERWDAMQGDERVRFCGGCQKNVYNLSAMSSEEAEALLADKENRPCVRFYRRADGTILTSDCPVGVRRKRVKRIASVGAGLALAVTAAGLAFTRTAVQGGMSIKPQATSPQPPTEVATPMGLPAPLPEEPAMMGEPAMPVDPVAAMGQLPVSESGTVAPPAHAPSNELHATPRRGQRARR